MSGMKFRDHVIVPSKLYACVNPLDTMRRHKASVLTILDVARVLHPVSLERTMKTKSHRPRDLCAP